MAPRASSICLRLLFAAAVLLARSWAAHLPPYVPALLVPVNPGGNVFNYDASLANSNWNTDPYSNTGSPTITPPLGAISYSPLPWKLAAATEYNDQRMGSTPEPPRGTAVSDAPVQPTNVNFVEVAEEPTPPDPNSVAPTSDVKVRGDIQRLDPPLPGFTSPFSILNPHHPFFPRARLRDLDVTEVAEWLQQDVDSERPQYWMPPGSNSDVGQVPFDQLASPYSRYGFVELSAETASRTRASLCVNCVFDDS